jgi:tRNA A-37 threonylcarbamoyl transferase component Bud32
VGEKSVIINPAFHSTFVDAGLDHFDILWQLDIKEVEPGNARRGGFAFVSELVIAREQVFLKRQKNVQRRSFRYPFGRPTFYFEYGYLRSLADHGAPIPDWCVYGEHFAEDGIESLLITRKINGRDLRSIARSGEEMTPHMQHVGDMLSWFHLRNLQHMAVQPNHIFIDDDGNCKIIDLERTRPRLSKMGAALRDYRQLIRRSPWLDDQCLSALLTNYPRPLAEQLRRELAPFI